MKRLLSILFLFLPILLLATQYRVDPAHSFVTFQVRHLIFSTVKGEFREFSGSYEITDGQLKALKGHVKVASVTTGSKKRDNHLVSNEFFNPQKYPTMKMELLYTKGDEAIVALQIKDRNEQVALKYTLQNNKLMLKGEISRKEFGLTWSKAIESTGAVVSDSVKIELQLQGIPLAP